MPQNEFGFNPQTLKRGLMANFPEDGNDFSV
jgi:hypothetical protein